jgi:putative phosphonate metabolism protein
MRVALYYAPAITDPLWTRACTWLGRDPEAGAPCPQPDIPGIAEATADPRLYGFHATLKPPMALRPGKSFEALVDAARGVAAGVPEFDLPPLRVAELHGFLALRETEPSPALQALSDACIAGLDEFRAPPTEQDLAHRRKNGLRPAEDAMLTRWGYPYAFSTWFFHMTLTRRLSPEERTKFQPAAEAFLVDALAASRRVTHIALFTQPRPGLPFAIARRIPLTG